MTITAEQIAEIEFLFMEGDFDLLDKLLPPLLAQDVPEAIRINASYSYGKNLSDEGFEKQYVAGIFRAFELGDLKAKDTVGMFYDLGEYVERDTVKASHIFKELAEQGDKNCMCIYATELIWGISTFEKDTKTGIDLMIKSSDLGSANACMYIADFHHKGEFGFEKSIEKRDEYRKLALGYDETTFDEYAEK